MITEKDFAINPGRKINLIKRILFFPNVTAFKIAKVIPTLSDYQKNYRARSASFSMVLASEVLIFTELFPKIDKFTSNRILVAIFCVNLIIELGFSKDIDKMGFDYYTYYNKYLLYVSIILSIAGLGWVFNDLIGK